MKRRRRLICKYPSSLSDAAAVTSLFSLFLLGCEPLTVWQIVDVLPQAQEVRVSQCGLGAESPPGVKLQQNHSTEG